jgi:hypothetical protein
MSSEAREFLEAQFEKTLEEYGDTDLGYCSEVRFPDNLCNSMLKEGASFLLTRLQADDEDVTGLIELDAGNELFESALDEFLAVGC